MSAGERVAARDLTPSQTEDLKRAVRLAEDDSSLSFSLYLGAAEGNPRAFAEKLHATLVNPENAVLVLCDPQRRVLEIVTGDEARRHVTDADCKLAAVGMAASFADGDLVGGLSAGLLQLGRDARKPRLLHVTDEA